MTLVQGWLVVSDCHLATVMHWFATCREKWALTRDNAYMQKEVYLLYRTANEERYTRHPDSHYITNIHYMGDASRLTRLTDMVTLLLNHLPLLKTASMIGRMTMNTYRAPCSLDTFITGIDAQWWEDMKKMPILSRYIEEASRRMVFHYNWELVFASADGTDRTGHPYKDTDHMRERCGFSIVDKKRLRYYLDLKPDL